VTAHLDGIIARLRDAEPRAGDTRVLAIDGRAGAGKSTLAGELAHELGAPAISMDWLYGGWDGLERGITTLADLVLEPLARGRVAVPRYDWLARRWGEPLVLERPPVLVLEGVGAGAVSAARRTSLLVWLELGPVERLARASAREGRTLVEHWAMWAEQEARYIARDDPAGRADLQLDTSGELPVPLGTEQ